MSCCPFCLDAARSLCFFETNLFFAIYNQSPILPGHSLIVSKRHLQSAVELTQEESQALFPFIQKVMLILAKAFKTESFDISLQDGLPAGQTVMHLHVHVIPRVVGDLANPGDWYYELEKADNAMIDSFTRPKLEHWQLIEITNRLRIVSNEIQKL